MELALVMHIEVAEVFAAIRPSEPTFTCFAADLPLRYFNNGPKRSLSIR